MLILVKSTGGKSITPTVRRCMLLNGPAERVSHAYLTCKLHTVTAILITKLGRIERIIFFSMLYLQTAGVEGLVASFIKHPLACPGQFCVTKFMK